MICDSSSAETAYNAILVAGAVSALVAAVTSHVVDRRRIALLGCLLSLALIAGAFIWASATKRS